MTVFSTRFPLSYHAWHVCHDRGIPVAVVLETLASSRTRWPIGEGLRCLVGPDGIRIIWSEPRDTVVTAYVRRRSRISTG